MANDTDLAIPIPLSRSLIDFHWFHFEETTKQNIKDITFLKIKYMLDDQMFMHFGGIYPFCCDQC